MKCELGLVQHFAYADSVRLTRERTLFNEVGATAVRSYFPNDEVYWQGGKTLSDFGKHCIELHFASWEGLNVYIGLNNDSRLTASENADCNEEIITLCASKNVKGYILGNEPDAWSARISDPAARASHRDWALGVLEQIHRIHPKADCHWTALHGWYDGLTASEENQRQWARFNFLWENESWLRTLGPCSNLYTSTGRLAAKAKPMRLAMVGEFNKRPGYPFQSGEIRELLNLPISVAFAYCLSSHVGYELMSVGGVRDERKIAALRNR